MSMQNTGMASDANWGAAGIALGAGIMEGRLEQARHAENLAMQQKVLNAITLQNNHDAAHVKNLEAARQQAEDLLFQSKFELIDKNVLIANLNRVIAAHRQIDASRVARITELRDTLTTYIEHSEQVDLHQKALIQAQAEMIEKREHYIQALEKGNDQSNTVAKFYQEEVDALKERIKGLEGQIAALQDANKKLGDLLTRSEQRIKLWKDQYTASCSERNTYYQRLEEGVYAGVLPEAVLDPATIPLNTEAPPTPPKALSTAIAQSQAEADAIATNFTPVNIFSKGNVPPKP